MSESSGRKSSLLKLEPRQENAPDGGSTCRKTPPLCTPEMGIPLVREKKPRQKGISDDLMGERMSDVETMPEGGPRRLRSMKVPNSLQWFSLTEKR